MLLPRGVQVKQQYRLEMQDANANTNYALIV